MSMRWFIAAGMCVTFVALAVASDSSEERFLSDPNRARVEQQDLVPSVNGKYCVLLRKLYMPQDEAAYRRFNDFGLWQGTAYGTHNDLPVGYWVYVYPNWYIWRDCVKPDAALPPGQQPLQLQVQVVPENPLTK